MTALVSRVAVCGSLSWSDAELVHAELDHLWTPRQVAGGSFRVLTGMAAGADALARSWAAQRGVALFAEPLAGPALPGEVHAYNRRLIGLQPDIVLAFKEEFAINWETDTCLSGTEHLCRLAAADGIPIRLNGTTCLRLPVPSRRPLRAAASQVRVWKWGAVELGLYLGDITKIPVDVIVNAANSGLLGGGGVDGAIHRASGPGLRAACENHTNLHGPLAAGGLLCTPAGALAARHVFHTVGPHWGEAESEGVASLTLATCYTSCLSMARDLEATSIAFPCISTGVYGYPLVPAAKVALSALRNSLLPAGREPLHRVMIVCYNRESVQAYEEALRAFQSVAP